MEDANRDTTNGSDAAEPAGEVREALSYVAEQAKEQVASAIESQKERAAEGLGGVADALRKTGEALGQQELGAVAPAIETAASQVEQLSELLQSADIEELAHEVGRFARRRPAAFLCGAFAAGFLGARLLRATSAKARDSRPKAA